MNNIISYLESSANAFPEKAAYVDEEESVTFAALRARAMTLASRILEVTLGEINVPVVVLLKKSVKCVTAFMRS